MPKLIITRGLPASGKTTFARAWVEVDPGNRIRVNRDDLRRMLHNGTFIKGVTEEVVALMRDADIRAALKNGKDVISDDTNLKLRVAKDLHKLAASCGADFEVDDRFLEVPVEECLRRDKLRENSVGEDVIKDFHRRYLAGKDGLPFPEIETGGRPVFEPLKVPDPARPVIVVDIDGTVAHNDGHRGFYDYDKVLKDQPKEDVIDTVTALALSKTLYDVVFVSGREDSCRELTAQWLQRHFKFNPSSSLLSRPNQEQDGWVRLLMRQAGDHRDDAIVKYELARDYISPWGDIRIVFDDRLRVCRMWHQIGLTVLRVGDPDADF